MEQNCREDHGVFQLRAAFDNVTNEDFVQVRVACPGTATSKAVANSSASQPLPIVIEQFELAASGTLTTLKELIRPCCYWAVSAYTMSFPWAASLPPQRRPRLLCSFI